MTDWIAALPMYDWPDRRAEVDAEWATIRDRLRDAGIDAPDALIRDFANLHELWRQPNLLFAQACWGPLQQGLLDEVQVVGQSSYDGIEGGQGELYSSAIVLRVLPSPLWGGSARSAGVGAEETQDLPPHWPAAPPDPPHKGKGQATLPLHLLRDARLAFNSTDSMSGVLALSEDLAALGETLDIFAECIETGGHRNSIKAVAEGKADVAAIDCRSWALAQLYEPAAREVQVVGWTRKRPGLPYITAKSTAPWIVEGLRDVLRRISGRA